MANINTLDVLDIDYNWKIYLKSGEIIEFIAGAECGCIFSTTKKQFCFWWRECFSRY